MTLVAGVDDEFLGRITRDPGTSDRALAGNALVIIVR